MSSVLVAEKQQEGRLIKDGPNEMTYHAVMRYQEENQKASLLAKQRDTVQHEEDRKRNLALSFISLFIESKEISREQFRDIISSLTDDGIKAIDNQFSELLMKKVRLINFVAISWLGLILFGIIASVWSGGNLIFAVPTSILLLFSCFGFVPVMLLEDNFFKGNGQPILPIQHMALRRYFKNEYGSDYFPCDELRKELRIIDKPHV